MTNYGRVKSTQQPSFIEITPNYVYVASNIETTTNIVDGVEETLYTYDYIGYTKDEYITTISVTNAQAIDSLAD